MAKEKATATRTAYVQRGGSDTWHFIAECSNYPKHKNIRATQGEKPTSGELCDQCLAKDGRRAGG